MLVVGAVAVISDGRTACTRRLVIVVTNHQRFDGVTCRKYYRLVQEEVIPLTAFQIHIIVGLGAARKGEFGLGQELAGRTTGCGLGTGTGNLDADVGNLVVTVEVAMTELAVSSVVHITRTRNLYYQILAGIGKRRIEIDGPFGGIMIFNRREGGHGGQAGGDHVASRAGTEVVGAGVAQAHRHGTAGEGNTCTLLRVERQRGDYGARGHTQLLSTIDHLVLIATVMPIAISRQLLVLNFTVANFYCVDGSGSGGSSRSDEVAPSVVPCIA